MKFYINDPHISKKGIEQCKELKKFLRNNDILSKKKIKCFCSILLRTQETALLSIPRYKIYISDYLKLSNFPTRNIEKQRERLKKYVKPHSIKRLGILDPEIIDKKNNYKKIVYNRQGNISLFLENNKKNFKENDTIIIISHGKLIRSFLNQKEKLKNCSLINIYNNQNDNLFHFRKEETNEHEYFNKKNIKYNILFEPSL
jgi:broad specificity phosphatase PhoE